MSCSDLIGASKGAVDPRVKPEDDIPEESEDDTPEESEDDTPEEPKDDMSEEAEGDIQFLPSALRQAVLSCASLLAVSWSCALLRKA